MLTDAVEHAVRDAPGQELDWGLPLGTGKDLTKLWLPEDRVPFSRPARWHGGAKEGNLTHHWPLASILGRSELK